MSDINSVMNFTPFASFHGTQSDLEQLLESEMELTWKKVDELKNKSKEKPKTIEEQATEIKKKFKKSMNLYEAYDPAKFETKTRVDLLFFEHLCQGLPEIQKIDKLVSGYYKTARALYEMVNRKPLNHKMLSTSLLSESHEKQEETFAKILSEHMNNFYYRLAPEKRREQYLSESQEYASTLIEKGMETDDAIRMSVKACLMESLIRNIAIPKSVQKYIKYLCEDEDYGKVFDQDKLKALWESFNRQTRNMSKIFAAAV